MMRTLAIGAIVVQFVAGGTLTGVGVTPIISTPTSSSTYDNGTSTTLTTLAGTFLADRPMNACTYTNSLGGSGSATLSGATWSVSSLALSVGSNVITLTCTDNAGTTGQDVITVTVSTTASSTLCADGLSNIRYVRSGATGTGTGLDWTNAHTALPSSLVRGRTYCVADGTYNGYPTDWFNDTESGTDRIVIAKATVSDHGTSTGWSDTFGDGQATWTGDLYFQYGYYTFSGQTRNESNWSDGNSYGFRVIGQFSMHGANFAPGGDSVIIEYVNGGGTEGSAWNSSDPLNFLYFCGCGGATGWDNITIRRNYFHNVKGGGANIGGGTGWIIEYNWFQNTFGKEIIKSQGSLQNAIIRYNVSKNVCQDVPAAGDPGGDANGCTAEIGIFDSGANSADGMIIHGNVFWNTISIDHSDSCILLGSPLQEPATVTNVVVANNTFAGIQGSICGVKIDATGTGQTIVNNLGHDISATFSFTASGTTPTIANNAEVVSDPFVNYASGDFHLSAAQTPGTTTAFTTDMDGCTYSDGAGWDQGAFAFPSC